jgi:hypothetical protein
MKEMSLTPKREDDEATDTNTRAPIAQIKIIAARRA